MGDDGLCRSELATSFILERIGCLLDGVSLERVTSLQYLLHKHFTSLSQ
jgi:hypothetical protein